MDLFDLSDEDLRIFWSALIAMCEDIHSPQDTLSETEWNRADVIKSQLDDEINKRSKSKK